MANILQKKKTFVLYFLLVFPIIKTDIYLPTSSVIVFYLFIICALDILDPQIVICYRKHKSHISCYKSKLTVIVNLIKFVPALVLL